MYLLVSVFFSTSEAVRKSMKLWDVSGDGMPWKVKLDVRDLGGHLDFTSRRAGAGTLSRRVRDATHGVAAVGALPLGFQVKLGLIRGKQLPAGLHAVEGSVRFCIVSECLSCRHCSGSLVLQDAFG